MVNTERPPRNYLAAQQLEAGFRQFVGRETQNTRLLSTPDVTIASSATPSETRINPDWQDWLLTSRNLTGTNIVNIRKDTEGNDVLVESLRPYRTPGRLLYDKGEWTADDENSPIGKIEALRKRAQEEMTRNHTPDSKKALEAEFRTELVGIFNDYASERWNGQRMVASGKDFRGITLTNMSSRNLISWRSDLLRTSNQAKEAVIFDFWDGVDNLTVKTPTYADNFVRNLYQELARNYDRENLTPPAKVFKELLDVKDAEGYLAIADLFYAGDMEKTFKNLSALAKLSNLKLPNHWHIFKGRTAEFRMLRHEIKNNTIKLEDTADSYVSISNKIDAGDMRKTYVKISALTSMSEISFPDWRLFTGTTDKFEFINLHLKNFPPGIDGMLELSNLLKDDNLKDFYQNSSAVAHMTNQKLPEGWHQYIGTVTSYKNHSLWLLDNPAAKLEDFQRQFNFKTLKIARIKLAALRKMGPPREVKEEWERKQQSTNATSYSGRKFPED